MTYKTEVKTGYYWADEPGGRKTRGVRIERERGRSFVWIPDADVYDLATTLADYLAQHREHARTTNHTNH
ncbi:hypothetical protein ACFWQK_09065 [Brachybacterium paraconglomeratum]